METLDLAESLHSRMAQGHPWVYRNQVAGSLELPTGTWVKVRCRRWTSYGLWDAQGAIAVRLFSRKRLPDADWVALRVGEAWETRAGVRSSATTAFRWIYGEGDGLPGIVVDLYGEYAVLQTYSESVAGLVPWVAQALRAHEGLHGVLWRRAGGDWKQVWGRPAPRDLTVEENGLLLRADLTAGQKTGLYFDQRDNRAWLAPWCAGRRVLDAFCYTGAFALYAARAGAASLTLCDAAEGALEAARQNLVLNQLSPESSELVCGDCFESLNRFRATGRRFDVVILDPPSLARDLAGRHAALRAYVRLNRLAIDLVEEGGLLATASCTSQVSPEAFREALGAAATQAGRRLLVVHEAGQAPDHPVPAHFPEGRYLKFVVGRVLEKP